MRKLKKIRIALLASFLICLIATLLCACGNDLDTPRGVGVNADYIAMWESVEEARSYQVEVKNVTSGEAEIYTSRTETLSLAKLGEGDYKIRVKAIGGAGNKKKSAWSRAVSFHRDYEPGFTFVLNENRTEYEIVASAKMAGDVVIDETYRGKPITSIGVAAFRDNKNVTSVTFGKNIRTVDTSAFQNCINLKTVTFTESVIEIGTSAFQGCYELTSITIPKNVKEISSSLFLNCNKLDKINLHDGITSIGSYAFSNCYALTEFTLPEGVTALGAYAFNGDIGLKTFTMNAATLTIGSYAFKNCTFLEKFNFSEQGALKSIGASAFEGCTALTSMHIPEGVVSIGASVFYGAKALDDVVIPASVTSVGTGAFKGSKFDLDSLANGELFYVVDKWVAGNNIGDTVTDLNLTRDMFPSNIYGIAKAAFSGCKALVSVDLPDSVKVVDSSAFKNCENLVRVGANNGGWITAETIGAYAFAYCTRLNYLYLGDGVKTILNGAFKGCSQLNNTTSYSMIPSTVIQIGQDAFKETRLWEVATDVVYAGNWAVGYKENSTARSVTLTPPSENITGGIVGIADYAFKQWSSVTTIEGMNTVQHIGIGAFRECLSLSSLSLNRTLAEIKPYTFFACQSLLTIDIPRRVTLIDAAAFAACENLVAVNNLKDSEIETIGYAAFYDCIGLKEVELFDDTLQLEELTLKTIGAFAFYYCTSLQKLVVPDSVTNIGSFAFGFASSLKSVKLSENITEIAPYLLSDCRRLREVKVPEKVETIGSYAFFNCWLLSEVELGNNVKSIGSGAFAYLPYLSHITIPESVEHIGEFAFLNCQALASVTLAESITTLDRFVFYASPFVSVYVEYESAPEDWNYRWNTNLRPVLWGCTLGEGGTYVQSVTITETTFPKTLLDYPLSAPYRAGYTFAGWTTEQGNAEKQVAADELSSLPVGTTVYALWTEGEIKDEHDEAYWDSVWQQMKEEEEARILANM